MPDKYRDSVKKVCSILQLEDNNVITFEDFVEQQFNKTYNEIKDEPEIKMLRKAWNISCESLLNVLDGISMIAKRLETLKESIKDE